MEKRSAFKMKPALKGAGIAAGALGLAGGGAVAGHAVGSSKTRNRLTNAFMYANDMENQAIADDFNAFNQQENEMIARDAFERGLLSAKKSPSKKSGAHIKTSSLENGVTEIYKLAFYQELENIAGDIGIEKIAMPIIPTGFGSLFIKGGGHRRQFSQSLNRLIGKTDKLRNEAQTAISGTNSIRGSQRPVLFGKRVKSLFVY